MANRNYQEFCARILRRLRRYAGDRRGNISTMVALLIVPLVGLLGLATETGGWYVIHRGAQNAADAAVVAAAQNGLINPSGTTYITEARSVSANLGYANGGSTTVTPVNGQACPAPGTGSACYKVTVSRDVPINLIKILGYTGTGGSGTQTVSASAIAGPVNVVTNYCVLTLGLHNEGITLNGAPTADFSGCNFMSNSDSTSGGHGATNCNGSSFTKADLVAAVGTADPNCGGVAYSGATAIVDPYTHYATDNPSDLTDTCSGSYPGAVWNSSTIFTPVSKFCGNVTVNGAVTIPSGTVVVIQNGSLDLVDNSRSVTAPNSTIVFNTTPSGTNKVPIVESGGGTLSISSPNTGPWSGVALYQNRQNGSTVPVTQSFSGNKPTWNVTGLVYMPYVDMEFKGIVSKYGYSCFAVVSYSFQISGNGAIYDVPMSQCIQAGLVLPNNIVSSRVALLQ